MKERVKQLCKEKGVSMNAAESEMGLAKGYIFIFKKCLIISEFLLSF